MNFKDLARMQGYDLDAMETELMEAISRAARAEDKNEELQKLVAGMEKELSSAKAQIADLVAEVFVLRETNRQLEESLAEAESRENDPVFLSRRLANL